MRLETPDFLSLGPSERSVANRELHEPELPGRLTSFKWPCHLRRKNQKRLSRTPTLLALKCSPPRKLFQRGTGLGLLANTDLFLESLEQCWTRPGFTLSRLSTLALFETLLRPFSPANRTDAINALIHEVFDTAGCYSTFITAA